MSKSWSKFTKEVRTVCKEQDISIRDLSKWIRDSIKGIEKKTFGYYLVSGKTPKFPKQKFDVTIPLGDYIHGFTIHEDKKQYVIYPVRFFFNFTEEISGDFITARYTFSDVWSLMIQDGVTNSAKLRKFSRKILDMAWK